VNVHVNSAGQLARLTCIDHQETSNGSGNPLGNILSIGAIAEYEKAFDPISKIDQTHERRDVLGGRMSSGNC
jgi:hypothetical protein